METATITDTPDTPDAPAPQRMKRRGLIAAAAALAVGVAASTPVSSAFTEVFPDGLRVRRTGYGGTIDTRDDAIQGYTSGGDNSGVFGRNDSAGGVGVTGVGTNGAGVYGQSTTSASSGVFGRSDNGQGVYGKSNAGYGVQGEGGSVGVYGHAYNSLGGAVGVQGVADYGTGVLGMANTGTNSSAGVYGIGHGGTAGIIGYADNLGSG